MIALNRQERGFLFIFFFFFMSQVLFGAVALDNPSSLRVAEVRQRLWPQIFGSLEIACAADVKLRGKSAIPDSLEGITRFVTVTTHFASEKKMLSLISAVGSDAALKRFEAVTSQCLSRLVTRMPDLQLVPGMPVAASGAAAPAAPISAKAAKKAAAAAAAPSSAAGSVAPAPVTPAPLGIWITLAADLVFLVIVEALMAFWQRPATMAAAEKLSVENAQAFLRCDITHEELAIAAALVVLQRKADFDLAFHSIPATARAPAFAADLLAHLPAALKSKVVLFDEAAAMLMPAGATFFERMATSEAACTSQLGSWAMALKSDKVERKAEVKKEVQQQAAALAAVPPPASQRPAGRAQGQGQRNHCFPCEKAGRAAAHPRETCEHYKCYGCKVSAPGHLYSSCPNPSVGGQCPPHIH